MRREVYNWLFKTSRKNAQDIRIQSLLEVEAFDRLLVDWKRLGYPFDNITPSYGTAIGSSGDRPAALAELMSILVNDGVKKPMVSLTHLHFAANTPFDTQLSIKPAKGEQPAAGSKSRKPCAARWRAWSRTAPPRGWRVRSRMPLANRSPSAARPAPATTASNATVAAASCSNRAWSTAPPPSSSIWATATSAP